MIQLNSITKIYKSKKGNNTKALNNVSLKFGNKGMTFILGKSGSGKTTLLNVIGGLDKYDSGDMIILGKSSKDFTQADFDSYRNTYIGFVFQDFNILEDYNVYENIVLALQLQQKEINKEEIDNLLAKLELSELKNRKVNELSGGQKQRVAIARALIKNPKVILADEPTGNLDSETGKQVMDLLKEISKEKLVIVVSHDNESAKTYGDRIIEIKDGYVVNDVSNSNMVDTDTEQYKIIKSKLPLKESFKLGLGSLRHKKIKLCFTILLTICSLLFMSIIDTLSSYSVTLAHSKLLKDKEEEFVQIEKYQFYSNKDFVNKMQLELTEEDIKNITDKISEKNSVIYSIRDKSGNDNYFQRIDELLHIPERIDGYVYSTNKPLSIEIVEGIDYLDNVKLIGRKPNKANEIVISNVIADLIIGKGIFTDKTEEIFKPKTYEEIISENQTYRFADSNNIKIVGIIDYDIKKYKNVRETFQNKTSSNWATEESSLYQDFLAKFNNIYNKIFVLEGFTKNLKIENILPLKKEYQYEISSDNISFKKGELVIATKPSLIQKEIEYFDGEKWVKIDSLKKNEIILNMGQFQNFYDTEDYKEKLTAYINQNLGKSQLELEKEFFQDYVEKYDVIGKKVSLKVNSNDGKEQKNYDDLIVIGIAGLITSEQDYYYVSKELLGEYEDRMMRTTGIFVLENTQKGLRKLMNEFPYNKTYSVKSTYSYDVVETVLKIDTLKKISFYIAIVFLVFTSILIANFMFFSISYRKKEIGILRGLGARNSDIAKIFLWEGSILSTISFIISSIGLIIATKLLNGIMMKDMNMLLTPFIITARQFIVILVLVYVIVFVSSTIPIIKISKKKPIDAILNK